MGEASDAIEAAVAIIPLAALAHTASFEIVAANEQCASLLQLPPHRLKGRLFRDFIPVSDSAAAQSVTNDLVQAALSGKPPAAGSRSSLRRLILNDGSEVTCWMHVGTASIAGAEVFVACMDLINPVLTDAHRWRQRADHDELTGLLRRRPLMESLEDSLANGDRVIFAFSDVDNLKTINDTHGHAAGDQVLAVIGRRLQQFAPAGSLISRISGDEFVVARTLPPNSSEPWASAVATLRAAIDRSLEEPIGWAGHQLKVSVSTGVAVSRPAEPRGPLFARADAAMYADKTTRRTARSMPVQRRA
jgi:diguanylate cyclase (GGDEF)-like protein